MNRLIHAIIGILAIALLLAVTLIMAAMVALLTLYDRLRAVVVAIAFPVRAAKERQNAYRQDLDICSCLLINELLRDNLVSHADVRGYLNLIQDSPPWQDVLDHGVRNGWLILRDEWWTATESGVVFADAYNQSIR